MWRRDDACPRQMSTGRGVSGHIPSRHSGSRHVSIRRRVPGRLPFGRSACRPNDECQGKYFPDARCHGKFHPDDECQGICLPDGECQGMSPPDNGYLGRCRPDDKCQGICLPDAACQGIFLSDNEYQGVCLLDAARIVQTTSHGFFFLFIHTRMKPV
jgi:hypothetical protein